MRVGVIGSGIAGLASAWLLDRRHEVHLFEREPRLGGHTHTHDVEVAGRRLAVDTGFLVYNEPTYPNLTRLFDELGVATRSSEMSFSVRCEACDLEYASSARGLLADPRNAIDRDVWRLVRDVRRFHALGRDLVDDPRYAQVPLGRFLATHGFSHTFRSHHLLPMAAAIWSSGTGDALAFPVATLLAFLRNHGLLGLTTHHPWRTVTGGARRYIDPMVRRLGPRVHVGTEIVAVTRGARTVQLRAADGTVDHVDAVVLACHADEALALLTDASPDEKELLGPWSYRRNEAYLHTDGRQLPRRAGARAAWNYRVDDCRTPTDRVSVSYDLVRLQSHDVPGDLVVTLNPAVPPPAEAVLRRAVYTHPVYTTESVATQPGLHAHDGARRTYFAGAYHGYGFHEDGLVSALDVASKLGVSWP